MTALQLAMTLENNKVVFHHKRHVHPEINSHLLPLAAPLLNPYLVPIDRSLIIRDAGKLHNPPSYSRADEWRCGMRMVPKKEYSDYYVERGKKVLRPPKDDSTTEWTEQRRHNLTESTRRSEQCEEICIGFPKKAKFPPRDETAQYDMESYMNRKQRSGASIDVMRNGIPCTIPGDRPFKDADREPGFYAKGGIVTGSTIQLRTATVPGGKGGGLVLPKSKGDEGKRLSYAEKMQRNELEYEKKNVVGLSVPSSKGGVDVPSFEQRTSCYLVTPEMEKD